MIEKPQRRKLRCFVASAFGYDDVDRVYVKLIKPTLGPLHVAVSRVDRVDHNDDIDNKIMELLTAADFCIADLTYARPSVYYEAGFAMASKPVIFIARKDHFKDRDNDPAGNLRVHFDLQMKNIIPWDGSDVTFKTRLKKRVKLVTRPLIQSLLSDAKKLKAREEFAALSQQQRIETLERIIEREIRSRSFRLENPDSLVYSRAWRNFCRLSSAFDAERKFRDVDITLRVYIEPQFQLKELRDVGYKKTFQPLKKPENAKARGRRQMVVSVFACLGKISPSNLERGFSHHAKRSDSDFREALHEEPKTGGLVRSFVMPIDQIDSPSDFRVCLGQALDYVCSAAARRFSNPNGIPILQPRVGPQRGTTLGHPPK
jgi:nucleoside 2-deoxyribosyltransferase